MIKDLYIENFKCFNKIKIDDIKKINFLVGKNNSGKTTILEALMLILSESRINVIENIKTMLVIIYFVHLLLIFTTKLIIGKIIAEECIKNIIIYPISSIFILPYSLSVL